MYLGIDVHKQSSQVAVRNEDGEIVREVRVETANLDEIAQQYAGSEAAIEATSNYYAIYETLDEYLDVSVANPSELKLIADSGTARLRENQQTASGYLARSPLRRCTIING